MPIPPEARENFNRRCVALTSKLSDPDFLQNRGLGNEVGIYTFCYDPSLELETRHFLRCLAQDDSLPCRLVEHNLYRIALERLESRNLLDRMDPMEKKHGRAWIIRQMNKICPSSFYAQEISSTPREPGDVVLITGIGEVYPFLRLHDLLENIQPLVRDVPIVAAYPGRFDGKTLQLFSRLEDENYYRAFDLV